MRPTRTVMYVKLADCTWTSRLREVVKLPYTLLRFVVTGEVRLFHFVGDKDYPLPVNWPTQKGAPNEQPCGSSPSTPSD